MIFDQRMVTILFLMSCTQKALTKADVSVLLNHKVTNIDYSAHNMIVTTVQNPYQKALRIRADHLVSTMQKSSGLVYQSPLVKTIKEIGFGSVAKIKIQFAESFWDLKNPRFMILLQDKPLTITRDIGTRCCTLP